MFNLIVNMSQPAIRVEDVSKQYRLGKIGTGTLTHDLNRWWHTVRGKQDPYLKIGEENDRTKKGSSEYVWALKNISFEVQQGEVVGIIGRNGAGKSTLLKLLSRTTLPTTGNIKVKGRIASLLEVGTGFHPELTGKENIFLNGAILGMTKTEIRSKFDEIVDFAGVEKYIDTPVKRYSSGMYVRLAFAVAAYLEPEILIVDEVLAVGDAEFQKKAIGKMQDVSKGQGRTVLFVSHNLNSIQQLCSSGFILTNGSLSFSGRIDEAVKIYRDSFYDFRERNIFKQNPNASNEITVMEAMLRNGENLPASHFDFDDEIVLVIRYRVNKYVQGSIINFIISDNSQELFMSFDTDKNIEKFNKREIGDYETLVVIPKNRLKPGLYDVTVGVGIANKKAIESIEKCLSFEVFSTKPNYLFSSFYKDRRGVVPMVLHWDTKVHELMTK